MKEMKENWANISAVKQHGRSDVLFLGVHVTFSLLFLISRIVLEEGSADSTLADHQFYPTHKSKNSFGLKFFQGLIQSQNMIE